MALPNPPSSPSGSTPRPVIPGWIWWVILAVLLAWNVLTFFAPRGAPTIPLPYSTFLDQVKAGNVSEMTIAGQNVDGVLKTAIPVPNATPVPSSTPGAVTQPPASDRFSTVLPAQPDPTFLPLLESKGVKVTAVDSSGGSWLLTLLVNAAPLLLLVGLMLYLGRQM